jgi:3D-(3,5/4)-trihydroxycyclohexane-1,2-dione acylhydrolase (decyclizing)
MTHVTTEDAIRSGRHVVRLTAAQAIVRYLQRQYSERDGDEVRLIPAIAGIFGHGNVTGLGQAIVEEGEALRFFQVRNEQSMVHMAAGYAKAMRRRATLACTASIGPGSTNLVTGAATATVNRLPVLLLPADAYASRHQGPVLQQIEHPVSFDVSVNDCLRPVSRFFDRINRPEQILASLPEAMRVLVDPVETGAVTISLPQDVQNEAYDYPAAFFDRRVWRISRVEPDRTAIDEALALLAQATRPMIIAGGGVHYSEAWDELGAFAEAAGIPVGETFVGRGAMRDEGSLVLRGAGITGTPAAGRIMREADLIIAVGTRLTDFTTGSHGAFQHPDVRFININVSGHDANKLGGLAIVADARRALSALTTGLRGQHRPSGLAYLAEVADIQRDWLETVDREVYASRLGEALGQGEVIGVLNRHARSGDVVVAASGTPAGDIHKLWDATNGREVQMEFGFSCMGFELPASLGIRLAGTNGEVFVFIGDGTFLMSPTELVTAAQEGLKVTVILSENHGFQAIRQLQVGKGGASFGNEVRDRDPAADALAGDYVQIDLAGAARSLGARTWYVETLDALTMALDEAREADGPCVIVVATEPHRYTPGSEVFWDISVAQVSDDPAVQAERQVYERQRIQQRFLG